MKAFNYTFNVLLMQKVYKILLLYITVDLFIIINVFIYLVQIWRKFF